jgi:hypothetical protein
MSGRVEEELLGEQPLFMQFYNYVREIGRFGFVFKVILLYINSVTIK